VVRRGIGSAILILATCLLGFAAWVAFFSKLHYDRAQHAAYDALRVELAAGTAPVGPTQVVNPNENNSPSELVPLGTPVAVLSIPKMGLRAVVLQGTTGSVLENGPGHLRDTQMPGQVGISVIMGRRAAYGGPFSKLSTLNPGDSITVVTGQTVANFDGAPFAPSGMLYVDADLTSKPQPAPPMVLSAADLSSSENAMGTETQAWLPIVLWGQLLVLVTLGLSLTWDVWGRWQTWLVAVPVLGYLVLSIADEVTRLLPNLT
jgi:sortase (surface protein transpeptidase)